MAGRAPGVFGQLKVDVGFATLSTTYQPTLFPQDCWAQGGYLAEVTSAEEEAALNEVINPDLQYWIGLNDEEQEGRRRD